jgi:hypothetical protein
MRSQALSANTWSSNPTPALSAGIPLNGTYLVKWGSGKVWPNAAANGYIGLMIGLSFPTVNPNQPDNRAAAFNPASGYQTATASEEITGLKADGSTNLGQSLFVTVAATVSIAGRYVEAYPLVIG